jgi:hypothetical protein
MNLSLYALNADTSSLAALQLKGDAECLISATNSVNINTNKLLLNGGSIYGKFSQTSSLTVENIAAESSIVGAGVGSMTVPSTSLTLGAMFSFKFGGVIQTLNNVQSITIRVKSGLIILAEHTMALEGVATPRGFEMEYDLVVKAIGGAATAVCHTNGQFTYNSTQSGGAYLGDSLNAENSTAFDTTVDNNFNITVQWGTASVSNIITSEIGVLRQAY